MYKKALLTLCLFTLLITFFAMPIQAQVGTAWVNRYNGPANSDDRAQAMTLDKSGNIYVTGYSTISGSVQVYTTIKYYPDSTTAWLRNYDGFANLGGQSYAIALDDAGNVYVTGSVVDTFLNNPPAPPILIVNCVTIKYRPNGDSVWVQKYRIPGSSGGRGYTIAVDNSGNVYVAGYSQYYGCFTIKYDSSGSMGWARTYGGSKDDKIQAMVLDKSGNIYVAGYCKVSGYNDYLTIKYFPNGDTAWVRKYDGSGNGEDQAVAIALDSSNDSVYVTGLSYASTSNYDYATVKYDKDGNKIWVAKYHGQSIGYDQAKAMAIDNSDYIYVTGQSIDSSGMYNYLTIKYFPNGDTVWTRRFRGEEHLGDVALAIAIDNSDNIYVTGTTYRSVGYNNYLTIKYNSDGNLLWDIEYNGSGNNDDVPAAIAVDDSGHAYVTGYSGGFGSGNDCATIKYWQDNLPDSFSLLLPLDGDSASNASGFDWETTTDPDPQDTIVRYDLYVSQSSVFRPDSTVIYDSLLASDYTGTVNIIKNCFWKVLAYDGRGAVRWSSQTWSVYLYKSGDSNADAKVTVSDVVFTINFLFKGGLRPVPLKSADANCDSQVTVSDVIYTINYLFKGGPAPGC